MLSKYGGEYRLLNCTTVQELIEQELELDIKYSDSASLLEKLQSRRHELRKLNKMTLAEVRLDLDKRISGMQIEHERGLRRAKEALNDIDTLLLKVNDWKAPRECRAIKASLLKKIRNIRQIWQTHSRADEDPYLKMLKTRSPEMT